MSKKITYNCVDNDVQIKFILHENEVDELWIGIKGMKEWTVVGFEDLKLALKKVNKEIYDRKNV